MNGFHESTVKGLHDSEYREAFADHFLNAWIATQIRGLREQRELTQVQLAERAGMKQSRISALENIDYSSWSVRTLQRLARAFDLRLVVEFRSFSKLFLGRTVPPDLEVFDKRSFSEPSFAEEPFFFPGIAGTQDQSAAAPVTIPQPDVADRRVSGDLRLSLVPRTGQSIRQEQPESSSPAPFGGAGDSNQQDGRNTALARSLEQMLA